MIALIGSRKGLFIYRFRRGRWKQEALHFAGVPCMIAHFDPHQGTIWAALGHGHFGPALHKSTDGGRSFVETARPAFAPELKESVAQFWELQSCPSGRIYVGTGPANLFVSTNQGQSFDLVEGMHNYPLRKTWQGGGTEHTALHTIRINPKDPKNIFVGVSCGGIFETKDRGKTWIARNKGVPAGFLPDPNPESGQDTHAFEIDLKTFKTIVQQNHCGLFKSIDGGESWFSIGESKGLVSSFGFCIQMDKDDARVFYTIPLLSDMQRMPKDNKIIVNRTINGGKTFQQLRKGLPQQEAYDLVYRRGFSAHRDLLMFGTSSGNLYVSHDLGDNFRNLSHNLPAIYSVELAEI